MYTYIYKLGQCQDFLGKTLCWIMIPWSLEEKDTDPDKDGKKYRDPDPKPNYVIIKKIELHGSAVH